MVRQTCGCGQANVWVWSGKCVGVVRLMLLMDGWRSGFVGVVIKPFQCSTLHRWMVGGVIT